MKNNSRDLYKEGWSTFDLAEAFHVAFALLALSRSEILPSLSEPVGVSDLASKHQVDPGILKVILEMLAARTRLIVRSGGKYKLSSTYDAYARFVLHQYLGAYQRNASALDRVLYDPSVAASLVDRAEHAKAYDEKPALSSTIIADLIVQLNLNHVLDLGCGTGIMLMDLATRVPSFVGWGLDINPSMCAAARKRLAVAPTPAKVGIFEGDCRVPMEGIPTTVIKQVRTLAAASVANEFFSDGTAETIAWLSRLRGLFPERIMLIGDYYGRLGKTRKPWSRDVALHDFVQVISGQGVPPSKLAEWKKIYLAARCTIIHAVEDSSSSFFVHVLRM